MQPNVTEVGTSAHYALVRGGAEILDYFDVIQDWLPLEPIATLPTQALTRLHPDDLALATHYYVQNAGSAVRDREGQTEPLFTGDFWLLTSQQVYSAAEYFAIYCKDTGFATLVGTATGGDGIGVNPYMCVLPNTGICFQFSAENGLNLDGSGNEEYGTQPDIAIQTGEDALEVCLAAIRENRG